jgi:protein SHQ1
MCVYHFTQTAQQSEPFPDHRADFADTEQIEELLAWTHPHLKSAADDGAAHPAIIFTEAENAAMLRLPRKECMLFSSSPTKTMSILTTRYVKKKNKDLASPQESRSLYLTLLTLLFAYAYDARTTQHDPTPESAWTIAALTPAFSALDPPPYHSPSPSISVGYLDTQDQQQLIETLIPSYRRALAMPLYRSWALAESCRTDAAGLLVRGTRTVLRCLLELRAILDAHQVYYVYSRLWLDDFCRWVQACAR